MNKLRKLLSDEKKKVGAERHKLGEVHALFEQIYDDYSITVDTVEEAQKEIQHKVKLRQPTLKFGNDCCRSSSRSSKQS